jgi:hypothetical protein
MCDKRFTKKFPKPKRAIRAWKVMLKPFRASHLITGPFYGIPLYKGATDQWLKASNQNYIRLGNKRTGFYVFAAKAGAERYAIHTRNVRIKNVVVPVMVRDLKSWGEHIPYLTTYRDVVYRAGEMKVSKAAFLKARGK